jgi:cytochrome b561
VTTASRYHPVLVTLHWIIAALLIADLTIGTVILTHIPNASPQKIEGLRAHMTGGLIILTLLTMRLAVRMMSTRPPRAQAGNALLDGIARVSHTLLYVVAFAMPLSGLIMGLQANLPAVVFFADGTLPADFWGYPLRYAHLFFARLLMALIALHIVGALYHVIIRRDGLFARMSYGRRFDVARGKPARSSESKE